MFSKIHPCVLGKVCGYRVSIEYVASQPQKCKSNDSVQIRNDYGKLTHFENSNEMDIRLSPKYAGAGTTKPQK